MHGDLVTFSVRLLYGGVVGILVGDEVCSFDIATVRVLAFSIEDFLVELDVVIIDGIIKCDGDHLGHVLGGQVSRGDGAVLGAKAVGQHALRGVTWWGSVRVVVNICHK